MSLKFEQNHFKKVVFCDFDGTITAVETFAGMLKEFAPQLSATIMPELYAKRLTLREGVRQLLESIPGKLYPEIVEYAKSKSIRPGLAELIDFLDTRDIPFIIISGGLRDMVETVIEKYGLKNRVAAIFAVDIDPSGDYLKVKSEFEGDTELVAKVEVMSKYSAEETIAIGDSVTDINMALKANLVFARDRLIEYMQAEKKPYIAWNDFFDIRDYLAKQ